MPKIKFQLNNAWRKAGRLLALPAMVAGVVLLLIGYDAGYGIVIGYLGCDSDMCDAGNRWHVLAYATVAGLLVWLFVFYGEAIPGTISRLFGRGGEISIANFIKISVGPETDPRAALAVGSGLDNINVANVIGKANDGNADALHQLGALFFYGKKDRGIERDKLKAAQCWRKAAERGLAAAQHNLGWACYHGKGMQQNKEEGIRWWRLAAEKNLAKSQFEIGTAHYRGEGVDQDKEEAVRWWRLAAEQGLAAAQDNLGVAYHRGDGVKKDVAEAAQWWRKAAEQGLAAAQTALGVLHYYGRGVKQNKEAVVRWWRLAAEQGHATAQNNLGWAYNKGKGVKQDIAEAARLYHLAAEQGRGKGSAAAQFDLGELYEDGRGVPQSHREAYIWFAIAHANGREDAAARMDGLASNWSGEEKRAVQAEAAQRYDDIRRREEQRVEDDLGMGLFLFEDAKGRPW